METKIPYRKPLSRPTQVNPFSLEFHGWMVVIVDMMSGVAIIGIAIVDMALLLK